MAPVTTPFDDELYVAARKARLDNLFHHVDPKALAGRTVLELGCGTGELGEAFAGFGCRVISVDVNPAYIDIVNQRYPRRETHVLDLEGFDADRFRDIDIVLCFGLLYHLERPTAFLRRLSTVADTVFLETVVADTDQAACEAVRETGPDQGHSGSGCRPSPAWIEMMMSSLGYEVRDISAGRANWGGEYPSVYDWEPRNDGAWMRGKAFLRKMFILERSASPGPPGL